MGVFRQFPYSNFHEMNMDEIIKIIKNMLEEWANYHAEWDRWQIELEEAWSEYQDDVNAQWEAYKDVMDEAWADMQDFINNYFDNLDVQEEINNKIVSMIQTGEFGLLVNEYIPPAVSAWLALHITEPTGVVIDTSLTVAGACADAKATGDALKYYPELSDTEIKSKGVCFSDENGNILSIISDSGICAKGFKSGQKKHVNTFTFNRVSTTKYINNLFPKGMDLALHIANYSDLDGMTSSVPVTYFYIDAEGVKTTLGQEYGYNYYKVSLPEDAYAIGVDCPPSLTPTSPKNLAFCVFEIPSFSPKPNEIHIASDGSGDFTSLRSAIESVTDANRYNPYIFYIHKGTYNILSEYSNDEILASGFKGLYIKDGMSLIGVGNPDDVIIHGELDPVTYDLTKRNDVSVINIVGNVSIKNLTVTAENIRYAIHDDTGTAIYNKVDVYYEDLRLSALNMTSGSNNYSYGAGCSYQKTMHFKNCDFGSAMVIHSANNITMSGHIYMENCSARFYNFGDYNSGVPTYVKMRNCKAQFINLELDYGPHAQFIDISGEGTCDAMIGCESGYIYNLGDCIEFTDQSISAGYGVKLNHIYGSISTTNNINDMFGISLGTKNGSAIVQFRGYINSNVLGLSGLSVGDYLTLNGSGAVVGGGTENNAIAKVTFVYNNVAYAKLIN